MVLAVVSSLFVRIEAMALISLFLFQSLLWANPGNPFTCAENVDFDDRSNQVFGAIYDPVSYKLMTIYPFEGTTFGVSGTLEGKQGIYLINQKGGAETIEFYPCHRVDRKKCLVAVSFPLGSKDPIGTAFLRAHIDAGSRVEVEEVTQIGRIRKLKTEAEGEFDKPNYKKHERQIKEDLSFAFFGTGGDFASIQTDGIVGEYRIGMGEPSKTEFGKSYQAFLAKVSLGYILEEEQKENAFHEKKFGAPSTPEKGKQVDLRAYDFLGQYFGPAVDSHFRNCGAVEKCMRDLMPCKFGDSQNSISIQTQDYLDRLQTERNQLETSGGGALN